MTFPKKIALLIATLALIVPLSSCDGDVNKIYVTGPYLNGKEAKEVYNAYLGTSIATLNSAKSQSASDVRHIANFVDGLLMNNEYGILERQLASAASHDTDFKNFYFTIKEGVNWYTYNGEVYTAENSTGQQVVQDVKADDFVNAAQIILNYSNGSQIAFMMTIFIDGAWEYYCYTEMLSLIKDNNRNYGGLGINWGALKEATADAKAEALRRLISYESGMNFEDVPYIDGDDLPNISNFSRVGVIAEKEYEIHYRLNQQARFFPTILTYAPFYPINRAFYKTHKWAGFGSSYDKMLYNGPFLCTEWSSTKVQYTRNPNYYRVEDVHIKTVNYTVAPDSISSAEIRGAFENGTIDGFSLSPDDTIGWEQYIEGPSKTGTIQNPYNSLVNSRKLDSIDYTYHFDLNVEREEDLSLQNYSEVALPDYPSNAVSNTNKALKIKEVRRLVLDAINFEFYNEQYKAAIEENQFQINTLTPPGYVFDENDKDYIDYYYEEYASKKGITVQEAKELVGPQSIAGVNYTDEEVATELLAPAQEAVAQYNAQNPESQITFPIYIEYLGTSGFSGEGATDEQVWISDFNNRVKGAETTPFLKIVNNSRISSSETWSTYGENGYYTLYSMGWIGDYADPLTYANTYVTNGDMSRFTGTRQPRDNYYLDESNILQHEVDGLLEKYDQLVDTAKTINNSNALRYKAFAEAEYVLLNEVYIIKPTAMLSQGWTASVSRAMGYENPTASYGLADYRLDGLWVLITPPTGAERQVARALQAELKAAALEETGPYNYVGSDAE